MDQLMIPPDAHAQYRCIADSFCDDDLFQDLVSNLILVVHGQPLPDREAEIDSYLDLLRAIFRTRAEDADVLVSETIIAGIAGAVTSEAKARLAVMSSECGRA